MEEDIKYRLSPIFRKRGIGFSGYGEYWIRVCDICGYSDALPTYWISSFGRAYNAGVKSGFMTQTISYDYLYISVYRTNGENKRIRMHRLVMLAFNYFEGCEKYEVNHKDGVKSHNWIWNLEWSTRKENMDHAVKCGLASSCEDSYRATISNEQAIFICELLSTGEYLGTEIADMVGCSLFVVRGIARRNSWTMISCNYIFRHRVSKSITNSELNKILEFVFMHDINEYETKADFCRAILYYTEGNDLNYEVKRVILCSIIENPYEYLEKLYNCIY